MEAGMWTWLEVAKLIASLATPIAVAIFGVYIHRVTKRFEHSQWRSQKLIEKRLAVYDDLAPLLNDALCYFTYVGSWKRIDPGAVVGWKRALDKRIHLAAPLFSPALFDACVTFQNLCFETYSGWGEDAKLRTHFKRRSEAWGEDWVPEWQALFSANPSDPQDIRAAYRGIMLAFAVDVGVLDKPNLPHSGQIPANVA